MPDKKENETEDVSVIRQFATAAKRLLRDGAKCWLVEMVETWATEYQEMRKRRDQFLSRRQSHIEAAQSSRPELLERESGSPSVGWEWECHEGTWVWMPPELCWSHSDLPDEDEELPLPPPARRGTSLPEKCAAFAAIRDYDNKGKHPVNPWAGCPDDPKAWAYRQLVNAVASMERNAPDEPYEDEERELWEWFSEVEADCRQRMNEKRPQTTDLARKGTDQDDSASHAAGEFDVTDAWVRLSQVAALMGVSKRTLANYLRRGVIPPADRIGGDGKPNLWRWSRLRPALLAYSRQILPEKFPASEIP